MRGEWAGAQGADPAAHIKLSEPGIPGALLQRKTGYWGMKSPGNRVIAPYVYRNHSVSCGWHTSRFGRASSRGQVAVVQNPLATKGLRPELPPPSLRMPRFSPGNERATRNRPAGRLLLEWLTDNIFSV